MDGELQSGGFLVVGGEFTSINGSVRNRLARLNPSTGALDEAFTIGVSGTSRPKVLTIEENGTGSAIYIGGDFSTVGTKNRSHIAKVAEGTGVANTAFNPGANASVRDIELGGTTTILVAGAFNQNWVIFTASMYVM